jgi:spermidine synthase
MASTRFAELAWAQTPMGEITLRRRRDPVLARDVLEVRLGDEYLMSSAFTTAEIALADLGLGLLGHPGPLDVVVGGLGLGYTGVAALADPRVRSVLVVEALAEVIGWHRQGLIADSAPLVSDPRVELVHGDFFALTAAPAGYDPGQPGRRFDVVLLDIDHSPRHLLSPAHAGFYSAQGIRGLAEHLHPGGVFALWSDDPPDEDLMSTLRTTLDEVAATPVAFPNPYTGGESSNTVYTARRPGTPD